MKIRMTIRVAKPSGEITSFNVLARCPHCENETSVTQYELRNESVQCQHCDEEFEIYLGD
jgi:ribosomal protein S27E